MSIDHSVSKVAGDVVTTVTNLLPSDYSEAESEGGAKLEFAAWDAVTIDNWNQNSEQEQLVL
jgi:hypothetical protein